MQIEPPHKNLTPKPLGRLDLNGRYELYVDGSPGPIKESGWSGWGLAMMAGENVIYEACGVTAERITSNAAELEAILHGLSYLSRLQLPSVVPLWTDSQYSADAIAKLPTTRRNNYCDEKGKPVANADRLKLICEMLYEMEMTDLTVIRWVKGHNKTIGNEIADKLSKEAAYKGKAYYQEHHTQNE